MKINEAIRFFKSLSTQATQKGEIKVYEKFLNTLSNLEKRNLTQQEKDSIEKELDAINIISRPQNKKRYFKKAFSKFERYLNEEHSLYQKRHFAGIGIALGMCFGVALGSALFRTTGASTGLVIGMLIGLLIGQYMDTKAEKEGRVLHFS